VKQSPDTTPTLAATPIPVCNYEGSNYRTDFWEGQGREYEDGVERVALRALLPATRQRAASRDAYGDAEGKEPSAGQRLIELGAGYGRLADLYGAFQAVVLTDRAFTQVQQARQRLGSDPRFGFVVADIYALPFRDGAADQIVSVRMLHHLVDVPRAFAEIARVVTAGGCYITEFASKRHLKAIVRYALRMQSEDPFSTAPHEFVLLNFDFHPGWMEQMLRQVGLTVDARRSVSHFRVGLLKRTVPVALLVGVDRALQRIGGLWPWTPSIFVRARKRR
jgi:ubiquinone/menaquinone biosynthesis C-methylase UbiE